MPLNVLKNVYNKLLGWIFLLTKPKTDIPLSTRPVMKDCEYTSLKEMESTSIWLKLKVVVWKNLIIRKRHWFLTLCEIAIPVVLFALIAYGRSQIDGMSKHYVTEPTYNFEQSSHNFYNDKFHYETKILYVPKTTFTDDLLRKVQLKFQLNVEALKGFNSESDLLAYYEKLAGNETLMAIVFKGLEGNGIPKNLNYIIRPFDKYTNWNTKELYTNMMQFVPDYAASTYIHKGFLAIKMAIDTSFVEMVTNKDFPFTLVMQEFPYPPHLEDSGLSDMFMYVLPLMTVFSFVFLCPTVIKRVVEEKSTGIKELMKMMGLKRWMLWLGWFLNTFIVNIFSVILITVFMKVELWGAKFPPIEHCSWSLFAVFLLLYCAAGTTFCFFISSLFKRPTLAMLIGIFAWILSLIVPSEIVNSIAMTWAFKVLFGLLPNMALWFGYQAISVYEMREVGAHWNNLFESASGGSDDVSMGNALVMFIVDIFVYMVLTVYIENIYPGPYGLAKPFHFPFSWCLGKIKPLFEKQVANKEDMRCEENEFCKIEPVHNLKPGIQIRNLKKTFDNVRAVDGLSIDIYEGQITALLGHNGAGKTTTMSIITGMIGASGGTVLINNHNIKNDLDKVRSSLGLCPQHNLHFTDLTVIEHLVFFGMLKGMSRSVAEEESEKLLRRMNLWTKRDYLASSLSGGMKRRLSLGIALTGNSKVLILDEPTSGLDPEARREIWDMLLSYRGSRTIIITTHFMEEADVLGDRIAIMDHGKLVCYGSSMYLKNEYGTGYHLTLIRNEEKYKLKHPEDNQVDEIIDLVRGIIKQAELKANLANYMTILLPFESKNSFSTLLAELEGNKEELCIENINMSVTTLEEVFLRAGSVSQRKGNGRGAALQRLTSVESSNSQDSLDVRCLKPTGWKLRWLKFASLWKKRCRITWKRKVSVLFHIFIALLVSFCTVRLGEKATMFTLESTDKIQLDLNKYGKTSVFYSQTGTDPDLLKIQRKYEEVVTKQKGDATYVSSVSEALIDKGVENIAFYKMHIVASAEFNVSEDGKKINAMYSNTAYHGAPISLNLLMNAVVKGLVGDEYSITCTNDPLPMMSGISTEEASKVQVAVLWFIWFPLGMLFLTSMFVIFPQMERMSNIKQLQLMCGIRSFCYWMMSYLFDLLTYIIVILLILIIVTTTSSCNLGIFSGKNEIGALFIILLCYGLSVIPCAYLFSYKKTVGSAIALFLIVSMFVSIITTIVVFMLELSGDDHYERVGKIIKHVFLLFPQFGLASTLVQFSIKAVSNYNWAVISEEHKRAKCKLDYNPCCDGLNTPQCEKYRSYFNGDKEIMTNVVEMATSLTIYFLILYLLENMTIRRCWNQLEVLIYNTIYRQKDVLDGKNTANIDSDKRRNNVKRENPKVDRGDGDCLNAENIQQEDLLHVRHLEKIYWGQKVVKGVSFEVKPGDCFGLLGVNGAGKTTTFRMLTGDEPLLTGDATILLSPEKSVCIRNNSKEYLENVGYCPQFDAINELLTGKEMLELFAALRGLDEEQEKHVKFWLENLGLNEYADKPCGEYSGGNKRKLSMAIALIGSPTLVMLDEPTSGVDPVSRRKLWETLSFIQQQPKKSSVLLTSHSMEECEALCNKLAIMKAGKLECCGSIPELKKQYGQGYTVMLKLKPVDLVVTVDLLEDNNSTASQSQPLNPSDRLDRKNKPGDKEEDPQTVKQLQEDFEKKYEGVCTLRDKHSGLLHYHINDTGKRWSQLFDEMEKLKSDHPVIEDYTVSETTLEEVFLSIARSGNK